MPERHGQIAAEHAFLLDRHLHGDHTWVGASSDAMLSQALTGADEAMYWPSDNADLNRCEETYRRAPEHLQARMLPTLERFRRHVAEGGLYCRGCDNSIGHWSTFHGFCPKCQEERGIHDEAFQRAVRFKAER